MSFTWTIPARVDRVVDGDSLVCHLRFLPGRELHGEHVRLAGVNAPELHHKGGAAAKAFVEELLPPGSEVTLVASQKEKFGRLLARVQLADGRDLADLLLAAGHAGPYTP